MQAIHEVAQVYSQSFPRGSALRIQEVDGTTTAPSSTGSGRVPLITSMCCVEVPLRKAIKHIYRPTLPTFHSLYSSV